MAGKNVVINQQLKLIKMFLIERTKKKPSIRSSLFATHLLEGSMPAAHLND